MGDGHHLANEDEIDRLMKVADKNGDGLLDYNEMIDLMKDIWDNGKDK